MSSTQSHKHLHISIHAANNINFEHNPNAHTQTLQPLTNNITRTEYLLTKTGRLNTGISHRSFSIQASSASHLFEVQE